MSKVVKTKYAKTFKKMSIDHEGFEDVVTLVTPHFNLNSRMFKCLDDESMTKKYRNAGGVVDHRYRSRFVYNMKNEDEKLQDFIKGLETVAKKTEVDFLSRFQDKSEKEHTSLTCRIPNRGLLVEDAEGARKTLSVEGVKDYFDFDNKRYDVQLAVTTKEVFVYTTDDEEEKRMLLFSIKQIKIHSEEDAPKEDLWN